MGICGRPVPPLFAARGPIEVMLFGEAPGPRGADRSGIPFWGDRSGRLVYRALVDAGMAEVPEAAWATWDGEALRQGGHRPRLRRAALSNALACCPTDDGRRFRPPTRAELLSSDNRARVRAELERAARRCPGTLPVIALGRHAEAMLSAISSDAPAFTLRYVPHPSPRALASGRRGATMVALEAEWRAALGRLLSDFRRAR